MSNKETRKANKNHICKFCDDSILKGEVYINISITPWCHPNNEGFSSWKIHTDCYRAGLEFYQDETEGGCFPYEGSFKEFKDFRDEFNQEVKSNG